MQLGCHVLVGAAERPAAALAISLGRHAKVAELRCCLCAHQEDVVACVASRGRSFDSGCRSALRPTLQIAVHPTMCVDMRESPCHLESHADPESGLQGGD